MLLMIFTRLSFPFSSKKLSALICGLLISFSGFSALKAEQQTALDELLKQYGVPSKVATQAMQSAHVNQTILDAISRPSEGKPWHQYRPIFLGDKRIKSGKKFMQKYKTELASAEKIYGVPAEIIGAIIGVETYYGGNKGHFSVLDALYTLGFHYPKRETFFRKEFVEYLKLAEEQNWPLRKIKGSYAGAMGFGQFMPSSYRNYGVDFSGDGNIDMLNNPIDAIGSVANYLAEHGWQAGQAIAFQAKLSKEHLKAAEALANTDLKSPYQWLELKKAGVTITDKKSANILTKTSQALNLLPLEQKTSIDHWLTFENFYVITTYNRSTKYAMAVFQLSQAIKEK